MSGRVITFYSFKGGSGRSMAVANVAWILATNGKRVLVIDWDLEAPGLHRYFLPLLRDDPELRKTDGLIDRLWSYVDLLLKPKEQWGNVADPLDLADLSKIALPLNLPPGAGGALHFVPAGRQSGEYAARTQGFDWTAFYERFGGARFIERMRETLLGPDAYDYVLIDSRTGLSDTSGVCTVDLPDVVVHCLVHNRQSVLGIVAAAASITQQQKRLIRQYPVPMRVEKNVPDFEGNWQFPRDRLNDLLADMTAEEKESYWAEAEIVYRARFAGGETLAAFVDRPAERNTLLADMMWLAAKVSGEESLRPIRLTDEQRETYQRAVALRDPRIAELNILARDAASAYPRLMEWLSELRQEGVDSPNWVEKLAKAVSSAANELAGLGRADDAMALADEAVESYRRILGQSKNFAASVFVNILSCHASICKKQGKLSEALSSARESMQISKEFFSNEEK